MKKVTGSGGRLAVEIGWKNAEIEGRGARMAWKRKQGWEDNRGVNSLSANLKRGSRRLGDDKVVVCAVCSGMQRWDEEQSSGMRVAEVQRTRMAVKW